MVRIWLYSAFLQGVLSEVAFPKNACKSKDSVKDLTAQLCSIQ